MDESLIASDVLGTPEVDIDCLNLAEFLRDNLNGLYPKYTVVKGIRTYDAFNVSLSEFPLLKVYRLSDTYRKRTIHCSSTAVITYAIAFPDVEKLPGILHWVSRNINKLLLKYELTTKAVLPVSNKFGYRSEYRLMYNEVNKETYPFLRFNITLVDCNEC